MNEKEGGPVILKTINLDKNQSCSDPGNGITSNGSC
jgi:hypothetical protein